MAKRSGSRQAGAEDHHAAYLNTLRTFDLPPARFDPKRAGARELIRYGLARRPDPKREPHLHALWHKAYSRPLKFVRPNFEIDHTLLANRARRQIKKVQDGRFVPSGWGGIVTKTTDFGFSPSEPANMVYAEWTVPSMEPDFDNPTTPMTVGFWVGLDGFTNNQVLQAGTAATVTGSSITYWPWFEWFPDPPVQITNFTISPGDLVTVLVCAPSPTSGFVSMLNRTTGATTSTGIPLASGVSASEGATAEWVVEGISADLPNFVLTGFHNCTAGTQHHGMDLSHPTETEIAGSSGNLTVSVDWQANDTVLVFWEGIR